MNTALPADLTVSRPRRAGRPKTPEDATLTATIAATRAALLRSRTPGDSEVTQAEVDLAALALVKAGAHPHPRLILRITGGSLGTVSQKFANWLQRLALKDVDPNERSLELPMKVGLRLQLLVAHLADAVREEVREIPNPTEALLAAARLGEHQAMRAQIIALEARCKKLTEALEAMTFRLAKTEAEARDRIVLNTQLDAAVQVLVDTLEQKLRPGKSANPALKRLLLLAQMNALRVVVHGPRRKKSSPPARPRAKASRAHRARPRRRVR